MKKIISLICLFTFSFFLNALEFTMSTEHPTYYYGEDIRIDMNIYNDSDVPIEIYLANSFPFDYCIDNIYYAFIVLIYPTTPTIAPYSRITVSRYHLDSIGATFLEPGVHQIQGRIPMGDNYYMYTPVSTFTVLDEVSNDMNNDNIQVCTVRNYPNPFNPTTTIEYEIPDDSMVELSIYDVRGKLIQVLDNSFKSKGKYQNKWNADNYTSGVYFIQLKTDAYTRMQKCILLK